MVRPSRRKGIEEVYGTKLEALPTSRPQAIPQPGMTKTATMRVASSRQGDARTQRSYVTANDYYITTNVPLNATNMRAANSSIATQPSMSKTTQMPVQIQGAATQAMPYGSMSNRRSNKSARQPMQIQSQPQKVHFVASDGNKGHGHMHPHGHNHPHAKQMPMQMTQRTVYAQNMDMEPNVAELSDKDLLISASNLNSRRQHSHSHHNQPHSHPHPLQHQLHQQQQLSNQNSTNNTNTIHHMHHAQQQQHQNQKHQQHQQHQQHQPHQSHKQHQQHQRQNHSQQQRGMQLSAVAEEEDKDDDPEEFFELIRQTVKTAVGTTICDVVSRNFHDLSSKMERFSNELKVTNDLFCKLHDEVTNKVVHYGEENTRHFRYLCMKSEYDKMFYQHQTMITGKNSSNQKVAAASQANLIPAAAVPTRVAKQSAALNQKSVKQQLASGKLGQGNLKKSTRECVKAQNPCACRSTSKSPPQQQMEEQQSSSEQSVNVKSSELGVREVLGQIQRFCTQMQLNDLKDEQPKYNSMTGIGISNIEIGKNTSSISGPLAVDPTGKEAKGKSHIGTPATAGGDGLDAEDETPVDSMDEIEIDNFQYSSDEMSSYSDADSDVKFSGSNTARAPLQSSRAKIPTQHSNKGAGDGQ
ncbi:hypothetical protein ACLKA7_009917 [Drosophila subpalustris]